MPVEWSIDAKELTDLANAIKRYQLRTRLEVRNVMNRNATRLRNQVIRNASGRPGPRIVTGQYITTIKARRGRGSLDRYSVSVTSDHPAAYRLEYGFVGMDALGRMYHQPPYPHFRPAVAKIQPILIQELSRSLVKTWEM